MASRATQGTKRWKRGIPSALLAVFFLFIALGAWAYSSPAGSSPDDDYHLASIWCATEDSSYCQPSDTANKRFVSTNLTSIYCFAQHKDVPASCLAEVDQNPSKFTLTSRGNFESQYPPVFYKAMSIMASDDVGISIILMRLVNSGIFVLLLASALFLSGVKDRERFFTIWVIALIPLGLFIIPSTNPSSWTITGVGIGWFALKVSLTSTGKRAWLAGLTYIICVILAAGSRPDGGVLMGVVSGVTILLCLRKRNFRIYKVLLLAVAGMIAVYFFAMSHQLVASTTAGLNDSGGAPSLSGVGLLGYNLVQLPEYFAGMFGYTPIGWMDTEMPSLVWLNITVILGAMLVINLGSSLGRRRIVLSIFAALIVIIALYMFQVSGARVGAFVQPRYLYPLVLTLMAMAYVTTKDELDPFAGRYIRWVIFAVTLSASGIALFVNVSRYLQGQTVGFKANLDDLRQAADVWWQSPVGPIAVVLIGLLSYGLASYLVLISRLPQDDRSREI